MPEPLALASPAAVVTGADGALWIADAGHGRVIAVAADGTVRAVWGGFDEPRGLAVDAAGATLYVADAGGRALYRIACATGAVTEVAVTADTPDRLALDEYGALLYVSLPGAGRIARIALGDGAVAPLSLPGLARPTGLALSPDRRRLYVADPGARSLWFVDLRAGRLGAAAEVRADDVTLTPPGLAIADARGGAVLGVNIRHGSVAPIWRADLSAPGGICFDRAHSSYLVADTDHDRLVRIAPDGSGCEPVALAASGPKG